MLDAVASVHDVLDGCLGWARRVRRRRRRRGRRARALLHVLIALSRHRLPAADALELARGGEARGGRGRRRRAGAAACADALLVLALDDAAPWAARAGALRTVEELTLPAAHFAAAADDAADGGERDDIACLTRRARARAPRSRAPRSRATRSGGARARSRRPRSAWSARRARAGRAGRRARWARSDAPDAAAARRALASLFGVVDNLLAFASEGAAAAARAHLSSGPNADFARARALPLAHALADEAASAGGGARAWAQLLLTLRVLVALTFRVRNCRRDVAEANPTERVCAMLGAELGGGAAAAARAARSRARSSRASRSCA